MKPLDFSWNGPIAFVIILLIGLFSCTKKCEIPVAEESQEETFDFCNPKTPIEMIEVYNLKGIMGNELNRGAFLLLPGSKESATIIEKYDFFKLGLFCPCNLPADVQFGDTLLLSGKVIVDYYSLYTHPLIATEGKCNPFHIESLKKLGRK